MTLIDRRRATRFEFVEDQWGSLHTLEPLRVRNVALEGVLIESATQLPVGSIHAIRLAHGENEAECQVAVRHLSPAGHAGNGHPFVIGLEFINPDDQAMALVRQILAKPADPAIPLEA